MNAVRTGRRAVLGIVVAVGLVGPGSLAGIAHGAARPIAEKGAWKEYVLGDGAATARPVRVVSTSGTVVNAKGLVERSGGPTTLTFTPDQPAPTIVLDYGREVGGLPFFDVGRAVAAGAEPVSLHAAYTESIGFLRSFADSTLAVDAAAGDTVVRPADVANVVVGGRLRVDDEDATVAAVGTSSPTTTLQAETSPADSNVKVASTRGIAVGATLRIGSDADAESVTVSSVGTSGAAGTGISFTPALTSTHAPGSRVVALGSGVTLTAPLSSSHAAGVPLAGLTSVLTGDRNGFNGVGVAPSRADTFALSGAGVVGNAPDRIQGGQRFQAITLTTPGTVGLTSLGIRLRHPDAASSDYEGRFLSSDERLNRIWYQGAYTNDTNMVPADALPGQTIPVILDGAKRDRRPWIGDLLVQGRTAFNSFGFGKKGSDYIKSTIAAFGATQAADGSIFGHIGDWTVSPPTGGFYSTSYSTYYVLDLASYYLHSGDVPFVRSQYDTMKKELGYNRARVDTSSGLLVTGPGDDGRDWDFYDGGKPGAVTASNAIYYKALTDASRVASDLADRFPDDASAAGWRADASGWKIEAASLKARINAALFDGRRGVYKLSDRDNGTHSGNAVPQDANSEAIVFGVAPATRHSGILRYLRENLWGRFGPQPYSRDADYSTIISPFVTGMEVDARFAAGDSRGALALIHNLWDQMTDRRGPYYTGALWEKLNQDGTNVDANASLAHGWASGPVSSLTNYLVGVRPESAGYRTWTIAPQPGDVRWAQGRVPTPSGAIVSRWRRGTGDTRFTLTVAAPSGTEGTVAVPSFGRPRTVTMDGKVVWRRGSPAPGVSAVQRGGAVWFTGVTGRHTFAWGNAASRGGRRS